MKKETKNLVKSVFMAIIVCCFHSVFKDEITTLVVKNIDLCYLISIISILLIIYIVLTTYIKEIIKYYFEENKINLFDYVMVFFMCISLYKIISYKELWVCTTLIFFIIVSVECMHIIIGHNKGESISKESKLYTLKELSKEENTNIDQNSLILLEEKAIENETEDLLDLSFVKQNIQNIILKCNPSKSFVLGLIGEWGIGKTSTMKLVEKSLLMHSNIKIKYFNPWNYEKNNDMLEAFLNLLSATLEESSNLEMIKYFNRYKKVLYKIIDDKVGISLFSNNNEENKLEKYKDIINDNISKELNKFVIVIDNLDRITRNQLDFFFNVINNMLNFRGIIYILCYDEKNLENILSTDNNYSLDFMDKIVNAKIYMPFIDIESLSQIGSRGIKNLLKQNGLTTKTKLQDNELNEIIDIISEDMGNLRTITRFINSLSLNLTPLKESKLYISDYIALEYIKFSNHELYKYIYNHRDYFYEKYIIDEITDLTSIIGGKENLYKLVTFIFDIKNSNHKYVNNRVMNDALENRLSNPRVMSAYFSQKENTDFSINTEIILFINAINRKSKLRAKELLKNLIDNYNETIIYSEIYIHSDGIINYEFMLECCLSYSYNDYLYNLIDKSIANTLINVDETLKWFSIKHPEKFLLFSSKYCRRNRYNHEIVQLIKSLVNHILESNIYKFSDSVAIIKENILTMIELGNAELLIEFLNKKLNRNTALSIISAFIVESKIGERKYTYNLNYENLYKYVDKKKLYRILDKIDQSNISPSEREILEVFYDEKKSTKKQISFDFKLTETTKNKN